MRFNPNEFFQRFSFELTQFSGISNQQDRGCHGGCFVCRRLAFTLICRAQLSMAEESFSRSIDASKTHRQDKTMQYQLHNDEMPRK